MKLTSIIGARPQFIKVAPLHRELSKWHEHVLIHTGQHYDYEMSKVFFEKLQIPEPDYNLGIGSGSHGEQTGRMLISIEQVLMKEKPDLVIVYGDTNSTLAGALAAAKLNLPIAHVEAGLRCYNMKVPEEINRVLTDHISSIFLCPSSIAIENLAREGIERNVHLVGDIMIQCLMEVEDKLSKEYLEKFGICDREYVLATIHRQENADVKTRLEAILLALRGCGDTVVLPLHPRTAKYAKLFGLDHLLQTSATFRILQPLDFITFASLEKHAKVIVTDSGGVQKEAHYFGVPCITIRNETEWIETVKEKWNVLVDANKDNIISAIRNARPGTSKMTRYGDTHVAERIARAINIKV